MSTRNPYDVMSCYRNLPVDVIRSRVSLEHLIADGNFLNESAFNMPSFPRLKTLSIDYNEVSFALQFCAKIVEYVRLMNDDGQAGLQQSSLAGSCCLPGTTF
ncbi:unnamed protein product [Heligmosomoides polygyrus]|uniref:Leucine-rich repeat protein n=1 Tax=Heligmosomoides polygyrus TaxID=6339 RepID=A0A183GRZ3_HELPZ|nr:unnamed protein product [Heligmosomoides polygyrus]